VRLYLNRLQKENNIKRTTRKENTHFPRKFPKRKGEGRGRMIGGIKKRKEISVDWQNRYRENVLGQNLAGNRYWLNVERLGKSH